ncbi:hypothetical protein [Pontiella agarivorans]|uniref:Uncharacterized protein n=1 Tax=Pontiella agarivorans TaxID=3038953 RepID=A0ABU5MXG6_9BACT|nr:hypothetical protein [Pontiella agarivorans]MDZ8118860.1 hypothetical protein [Pontiella agarivorans]
MNKQIQINQKLMEREDLLVDVFDLERQINVILGGEPYPLTPPDDLPSRRKRKKSKRKAAPKKAPPVRLRKLDPETEKAYRVDYQEKGEFKTEIHFDARPVALLINTDLPDIRVLKVETIAQDETGELQTIEVIYQSEPEEALGISEG